MKEYFEKQLNDGDKVTEENLPKLRGCGFYGTKYKVDDKVFSFMLYTPIGNDARISIHMIVEEEFERFEKVYNFIKYEGIFPVFKKKEI